jgi:hypothetical protein
MFDRIAALLVIVGMTCGCPSSLAANETDDTAMAHNLQTQVHFLWQKREFAQIEAAVKEFKDNKTRWPSGGWRLPALYNGFKEAFAREDHRQIARVMWTEIYAEWQKAYPNSPTPHIANAQTLVAEAWSIRGTGFVQDVWPEDMAKFLARMKEAKEVLQKHKALVASDPYSYMLAADIGIALGERRREFFQRLEEGIKKYPDYGGLYYEGARYLSPQWGGNIHDFVTWIDRAGEQTRAFEGMVIYAGIHSNYLMWSYAKDLLAASEGHRAKMREGIADTLARYPSWPNVQAMMYTACDLREPDEVEKIFVVMRRLNHGALPTSSGDPAVVCSWPAEPVADPAVLAPPLPDTNPRVRKARTP